MDTNSARSIGTAMFKKRESRTRRMQITCANHHTTMRVIIVVSGYRRDEIKGYGNPDSQRKFEGSDFSQATNRESGAGIDANSLSRFVPPPVDRLRHPSFYLHLSLCLQAA